MIDTLITAEELVTKAMLRARIDNLERLCRDLLFLQASDMRLSDARHDLAWRLVGSGEAVGWEAAVDASQEAR